MLSTSPLNAQYGVSPIGSTIAVKFDQDKLHGEDIDVLGKMRCLEQENSELQRVVDELKSSLQVESNESSARQAQIEALTKRNEELQFMIRLEKRVGAALNAQLSSRETGLAAVQTQLIEYEKLSNGEGPHDTTEIAAHALPPSRISSAIAIESIDDEMTKDNPVDIDTKSKNLSSLNGDEAVQRKLALCTVTTEPSLNEGPKVLNSPAETHRCEVAVGSMDRNVANNQSFSVPAQNGDPSYDDLLDRVLHAEARAKALTDQLESMPSSLQLAVAERHVLESKLRQMVALKELEISQLKDDMVIRVMSVSVGVYNDAI